MEKWTNSPNLKVLIDEEPEGIIYEVDEDKGCYWGEKDGMVIFGAYNFERGGNQGGFGGREWDIPIETELFHDIPVSKRHVAGPWSSRSSVMNKWFPDSFAVAYTTSEKAWKRGHTFTGGHMLVTKVREALHHLDVDAKLINLRVYDEIMGTQKNIGGEEQYRLVHESGRWKPSEDVDPALKDFLHGFRAECSRCDYYTRVFGISRREYNALDYESKKCGNCGEGALRVRLQ